MYIGGEIFRKKKQIEEQKSKKEKSVQNLLIFLLLSVYYFRKFVLLLRRRMQKGVISIVLSDENGVEVRYKGDNRHLVTMLGALDIAKGWVLDTIQAGGNVSASETPRKGEEKLQKSDALGHYLELWGKIEKRIQAINKADAQAEFTVDTSLLHNL